MKQVPCKRRGCVGKVVLVHDERGRRVAIDPQAHPDGTLHIAWHESVAIPDRIVGHVESDGYRRHRCSKSLSRPA